MTWSYTGMTKYCPLYKGTKKTVIITWMHHWERCEYCLLKLPVSKVNLKVLEK